MHFMGIREIEKETKGSQIGEEEEEAALAELKGAERNWQKNEDGGISISNLLRKLKTKICRLFLNLEHILKPHLGKIP